MEHPIMTKIKRRWGLKTVLIKEFLAEFLGIFLLILFGCGATAQAVLSKGRLGEPLTVHIGFSIGLMMASCVAGGVSGGHVNPAVSFAMVILGKLPLKKFPVYVLAQFLGAFTGSCAVYAQCHDALMEYNKGELTVTGVNATALIFASYPAEHLSGLNGFVDQVIGTTVLILCILAINDMGAPKGVEPVLIGLILMGIGVTMGLNCDYPINPARDLGPRIFTAVAGWGMGVFSAGGFWWWIPVVGPMVGGVLGAALYLFLIELHHSEPRSSRLHCRGESHRDEPQQPNLQRAKEAQQPDDELTMDIKVKNDRIIVGDVKGEPKNEQEKDSLLLSPIGKDFYTEAPKFPVNFVIRS